MLFDVLLPIADVYGDVSLVIAWYLRGHYLYALAMAIPMFLNYIFSSYKWWSFEEWKHKWWSWILVVFQLWQPWRALKVIFLLYKKDDKAQAKKKEMMREVSSIEPFVESVPTVFIMTALWVHGLGHNRYPWNRYEFNSGFCDDAGPFIRTGNNTNLSVQEHNFCAIFGGFGGHWLFFTSYGISLFAASLGITKFLQHGRCAILSTNGTLGGLLTGRFSTVFIVTLLALSSKVIMIGGLTRMAGKGLTLYFSALFVSLCVIPNLVLAIVGIAKVTGFNKRLFEIMFEYPAIFLLPVFSNFAIGPRRLFTLSNAQEKGSQNDLIVSIPLTGLNTAVTLICYIIAIYIADSLTLKTHSTLRRFSDNLVPAVGLTLIFTIVSLYPDKCCCPGYCPSSCFEVHCDHIDTAKPIKDIERV